MTETTVPVAPPPVDVDAQSARGLRWSAVRQLVTNIVASAGGLVFLRLLRPEDLGAIGLALLARLSGRSRDVVCLGTP